MSLLSNKRLIAAKIESTYGTDPVPTGTNAMLLKNLDVQPIQAELVDRDLIRPYLGISQALLAAVAVQLSFEIEYAAGGVIGKAPAYDSLLRACGFAPTISTTSITAAIASSVVTVTKVTHGLLTGDKVIPSGFTDAAANIPAGVTITVTDANTFTYPAAGAVDDATADGTPVYATQIEYKPISTGFQSCSIYFNVDGVLHKITGARGSVEMSLSVKGIPTFKFSLTGLYSEPTDTPALTPDFSGFTVPKLASTQNTPSFSLAGYSALLESCSLNLSNQIEHVILIGSEEVKILNRSPQGSLVFEAPTIAEKDYWDLIIANTATTLALNHGATNGHKVNLSCPNISLGNPTYQDSNGVQMLSVPFRCEPTTSGNDEISFIFK